MEDPTDRLLAQLEGEATGPAGQQRIDNSITAELEGRPHTIAGIPICPLSLSAVMLLHALQNEIMAGVRVLDMVNPTLAALQWLYVMDASRELTEVGDVVFGDEAGRLPEFIRYGESIAAADASAVTTEIIVFVNDQASTRVKAEPPKEFGGKASQSKNG